MTNENQELKEIKEELKKIRKEQEFSNNAQGYGCLGFVAFVIIMAILL